MSIVCLVILAPALMLFTVDPGTRIVQQVAREWRQAGKLPAGDDVTGREDDRAFWAEVEQRQGASLQEARQQKHRRRRANAEFEGQHPRSRAGLFSRKALVKQVTRPPQREILAAGQTIQMELEDQEGGRAVAYVRETLTRALQTVPLGIGHVVVKGQYPGIEEQAAVTGGLDTGEPVTIWLNMEKLPEFHPRRTIMHELGHVYDRTTMPESARDRFRGIMGETRAWRSPPNSPHEQFAEAYGLIGSGVPWERARNQVGAYGFEPNRRQYEQLRKLFSGLRVVAQANRAKTR